MTRNLSRRKWVLTVGLVGSAGLAGCNSVGSSGSDARFEPTVESFDDEVQQGDDVTVSFRVENTGDGAGTQEIRLQVDDSTVDSKTGVQLDAGGTYADQFTYTTGDGDPPEIEVGIVTDDGATRRTVAVTAPPPVEALDMRIRDVRSPALGLTSATIPVVFEITNTDQNRAIPDPEIDYNAYVNDTEIASDDLVLGRLEPGETVTTELSLLVKYENYGAALVDAIKQQSFTTRLAGTVSAAGASTTFEDEF